MPAKTQFRMLIAGIQWPPETFLYRLIDGLNQAGVAVTVGTDRPPVELQGKVDWLPTPAWNAGRLRRLLRLSGLVGRAGFGGFRDIRTFAPYVQKREGFARRLEMWNRLLPYAGRRWDLIYFPWNSAAIGCLPVFDLGCPVVLSCRGSQVSVAPHNPEREELREGLRATFARAAVVHCVSEATRKDASRMGLNPNKAWIIRPAVDPEHFCPAPVRPSHGAEFVVITVGSLIWRKGFEWGLLAVRQLADRGVPVRFDIIGDGPERQRVLYTIADLGLEKHVRWLGRKSPNEILEQVRQADAFVLPSLGEGISNAVLEAMACGIPVVTTDCGGMREAVTDGVEGFVVAQRDAAGMADALAKLAGDAALRQRMGAAGRERVVRNFSLNQQIDQWVRLSRSILEGERPIRANAAPVSVAAQMGTSGNSGELPVPVGAQRRCFFIGVGLSLGAVAQHFLALARELARRGHKVVILSWPARWQVHEDPEGNPAIMSWPSPRPTQWQDARFLHRLIRQHRPDCLIANFGAENVMTLVGAVCRVPVRICWYHTLTDQLRLDHRYSPLWHRYLVLRKTLVSRLVTQIVANSQASAVDAQRAYSVPEQKCHVQYLSLPDHPLHGVAAPGARGDTRLLCVGRLAASKGQDVLLRAAAGLGRRGLPCEIVFVGRGPAESELRALAANLGLTERCQFLGGMDHEEVLRQMAQSTVTVVPSRSEAFGLVSVESLSVGTPVVASAVGGIPEVIRDGCEGFLVPPDNHAALEEKLALLLSNVELRRQMERAARARFLSTFAQQQVIPRQADWFEQLVNQRVA